MAARSGSQCGPVPDGMSVAANAWPSMVPATLAARRVPRSTSEPGTVTKVANAPSFSMRAENVRSSGCGEEVMTGRPPRGRGLIALASPLLGRARRPPVGDIARQQDRTQQEQPDQRENHTGG